MVQASNKQSRQANKQNEGCKFTVSEVQKQKNRERHKHNLHKLFKPISRQFKGSRTWQKCLTQTNLDQQVNN